MLCGGARAAGSCCSSLYYVIQLLVERHSARRPARDDGAAPGVHRRLPRRGVDAGARRRARDPPSLSRLPRQSLGAAADRRRADRRHDARRARDGARRRRRAARRAHRSNAKPDEALLANARVEAAMLFGIVVRAADAARDVVRAGAGRVPGLRRRGRRWRRACAPRSPTGGPSRSTACCSFFFGAVLPGIAIALHRAPRAAVRRARYVIALTVVPYRLPVRRGAGDLGLRRLPRHLPRRRSAPGPAPRLGDGKRRAMRTPDRRRRQLIPASARMALRRPRASRIRAPAT